MKKIIDIDYINVRDAHVHGIINPTFIMYGNCDLEKYDFEVEVDGIKRKAKFKPDLASDNYELIVPLNNSDKLVEVYLIANNERQLVCIRENTRMKRIKSKIRVILRKVFGNMAHRLRKLKYIIRVLFNELKFILKNHTVKGSIKRIKYNLSRLELEITFYNFMKQEDYLEWLEVNEKEDKEILSFDYNPLISICIPVYNVERKYLSECLDSILNQTYQNFEICLSNDCSTLKETLDTLEEYEKKDNRIKVFHRKENGHISKATNDALAIASGEFIGLMDNDDLLTKNALYECVKVLNENPNLDFIYSDEDKIDLAGKRRDPHFKSDFAPDSILGSNYICHFEIMRKSIVDKIGGFRVGLEGAQDYDIFLRFFEQTTPERIYHIPKVLYHWRMIEGSTAAEIDNKGYAIERGRQAVADALERRGINADVKVHPRVPYYIVEYKYEIEPMISIIIPTKDYADVTEQCL
ncbi:MAG TPA: glycosyltransferase, partial [[Clostridium] spiroforme]|nr:glycosyltransferase [Thomasclavelia spiroformis]